MEVVFSHKPSQDKVNDFHTKQQEEQDVITSDNFDYNLITNKSGIMHNLENPLDVSTLSIKHQ